MKLAIVGTSDSAKDAPYNDPSWEIWTLGRNHVWIPRFDKWFELHSLKVLLKAKTQQIYYDHLKTSGDKLYLVEPRFDCPDAKIFPKQEIIDKHGKYFTSSIAWMLIHAIEQNPEKIGIWGVDMRGDNEYAHQRPCIEYWLRMAQDKGINLYVHPTSSLLNGPSYCDDTYYDILDMIPIAKEAAHYKQGWLDALLNLKRSFG